MAYSHIMTTIQNQEKLFKLGQCYYDQPLSLFNLQWFSLNHYLKTSEPLQIKQWAQLESSLKEGHLFNELVIIQIEDENDLNSLSKEQQELIIGKTISISIGTCS